MTLVARRAYRRLGLLLVASLMTAMADSPRAAEPYREEAVKAAFLHRFTGFVEWPAPALADDAFRVTVLGAPEVSEELQRLLQGRQVKGLPIVLTTQLPRSGPKPHLLYVGRGYDGDLRRLLRRFDESPTLVVTDHRRGLEEGGTINFLLVDQRVRFEVSLEPAQKAGLTINSQLLGVAVRVLDGRGGSPP